MHFQIDRTVRHFYILVTAVFCLTSLDQGNTVQPYKAEDFIRIHHQFGRQPYTANVKPKYYPGVRLILRMNAPIMSVSDGKVISDCQNCKRDKGNFIMIKHNDSTVITYYHLSEVRVKAGEEVTKGQEIGKSGNSGLTTMSNGLGLSVRVNDLPVDPADYLSIVKRAGN